MYFTPDQTDIGILFIVTYGHVLVNVIKELDLSINELY